MSNMNCTICGKPIKLTPSAAERARRHGGKPSDYTNLFTEHTDCILEKRRQETSELCQRLKNEYQQLDQAGIYPLTVLRERYR